MAEPARTDVIVVGDGPSGLRLAARLARAGLAVTLVGGDPRRPTGGWMPAPASLARTLPPAAVLEPSLPVELVLPGDLRLPTGARLALLDRDAARRSGWATARTCGVLRHRALDDTDATRVQVLRRNGRPAGLRWRDGTTLEAPLTVDCSGVGRLRGAIRGAWMPPDDHATEDHELVARARIGADVGQLPAPWCGRAQLLLAPLPDPSIGWRCAPRRGEQLFTAVAHGPGSARDGERSARPGADAGVRPCRRPMDTLVDDGLAVVGAAAGMLDPLLGIDLPIALAGVDAVAGPLLDALRRAGPRRGPVPRAALFPATAAFQRSAGAVVAVRHRLRRWLHALDPGQREGLVLSGVLPPAWWADVVEGGGLRPRLPIPGPRALARLPASLRGELWRTLTDGARLWAHHARYPAAHDRFAIDGWQAVAERLDGRVQNKKKPARRE